MESGAFFTKYQYVIVRQFINTDIANDLYQYTLQNLNNGNMTDDQVPGSPSFYQDEKMSQLHQTIRGRVEDSLSMPLLPTFNYYRTYRNGAILRAHKDRRTCEIGVSLNLGQQGNLWPFWLLDAKENAESIVLAPGDAVIYRGSQLMHWRSELKDADYVSQAFFFFVHASKWGKLSQKTEIIKKLFKKCRKILNIKSY